MDFPSYIVPDPLNTGGLKTLVPIGFTGQLMMWPMDTAPGGWLICDGSAISRTLYTDLFRFLNPCKGSFTVTIASPGVVTMTSHGFNTGDQVYLTTSGALPTGLSANTLYYIIKIDANSFNLATSRANAVAGTKINTSGSQSGTHLLYFCPWGLGDGSTTFNIPDLRANVAGGYKSGDTNFGYLGKTGGEATHLLTTAEIPSHSHANQGGTVSGGNTSGFLVGTTTLGPLPGNVAAGGGGSHNNLQPYATINFVIKH